MLGATVAQTDFEQMGDAGVGGYYKGGINTASPNYGVRFIWQPNLRLYRWFRD